MFLCDAQQEARMPARRCLWSTVAVRIGGFPAKSTTAIPFCPVPGISRIALQNHAGSSSDNHRFAGSFPGAAGLPL
jgi:hypothetical protein